MLPMLERATIPQKVLKIFQSLVIGFIGYSSFRICYLVFHPHCFFATIYHSNLLYLFHLKSLKILSSKIKYYLPLLTKRARGNILRLTAIQGGNPLPKVRGFFMPKFNNQIWSECPGVREVRGWFLVTTVNARAFF